MKMINLRALATTTFSVSLLMVGCGGSSGGGNQGGTNPPPPPPPDNTQLAAPGITSATSIGFAFTKESDNLTLYVFENDRGDSDGDGSGDSDCNAACADTWPPLLANAASVADGAFTIITRDDGSNLQWAFHGLPLYTYSGDAAAGDVNGEGLNGIWFVARPDPWLEADVDATAKGTVFVGRGSVTNVDGSGGQAADRADRDGLTLYTFENDRNDTDGDGPGDSDCNAACAETWPPLYADDGATESGSFTIVARDDGTRQWALQGLPLYFFTPDAAPGDTSGEGLGSVWFVARPKPFETADSEIGPILAGATSVPGVDAAGAMTLDRANLAGFSLYVFDNDANDTDGDGAGDSDCNAGCAVFWPPLFADAAATPTGPFTLVTRDDGSLQWAINGEPLYFFANDTAAGDVAGDEFNGVWHLARTAPIQVGGAIFEARGEIADVDAAGNQAGTVSDKTGFTLYRFDDDRNDAEGDGPDDSDCNGGCAVTWPPLYATAADKSVGDFGIIDRDDGSQQWVYQGDPLYFYVGDVTAADVTGVYGTWFTVSPGTTQQPSRRDDY